jgi:hypothetical protein
LWKAIVRRQISLKDTPLSTTTSAVRDTWAKPVFQVLRADGEIVTAFAIMEYAPAYHSIWLRMQPPAFQVNLEMDNSYYKQFYNIHAVLLSFWTLAALLGFECFANSQCSLRVPNSGCIDGFCQCSRGYSPYRRHLCLPRESINFTIRSYLKLKPTNYTFVPPIQRLGWATSASAMINVVYPKSTHTANS